MSVGSTTVDSDGLGCSERVARLACASRTDQPSVNKRQGESARKTRGDARVVRYVKNYRLNEEGIRAFVELFLRDVPREPKRPQTKH